MPPCLGPLPLNFKYALLTPASLETLKHPGGYITQLFQCECGNTAWLRINSVRKGNVKSCGCLRLSGLPKIDWGELPEQKERRDYTSYNCYLSWANMKQRCSNPNAPQYADYGGRGISYDIRWEQFKNFLEDMGERGKNLSLERVNNDLGYSKSNCIWADRKTQMSNRRISPQNKSD